MKRARPEEGRTDPFRHTDLIERLRNAAPELDWSGPAPLFALAHLEPLAVAGMLRAGEHFAARDSSATLRQLLDVVVEKGLARHGASSIPELGALLERRADAAAPDTIQRLSAAAGTEHAATIGPLLEVALARAPAHPGLLRLASEAAIRAGEVARAHELLTRLARAEATQATVNLVHRRRQALPAPDGPTVRAALLSSYSIETLAPYLDLELRALGLTPELYVAPFNSWTQEVMAEDSGLHRFSPEIAFLAVAIDDLVPDLASGAGPAGLEAAGREAVDRVLFAARRFAESADAVLVVHSFHSAYRSPGGAVETSTALTREHWIHGLNRQLAEQLATLPRTYLLDMQEVLARRPGGSADHPKLRYLAAMRLADGVLGEVARAHARYVAPLKGLTRKCVVLDLDNTLWGGIVGEDGLHGIRLGNTSPGIEYQDFQRYLRTLTERGILLAVNSKNNPDDALEVIRHHEGMILREENFSAIRINWLPKSENMASIADELNLGVDQMVFIDDSPEERQLMRQVFPRVLTVDLPHDPALYRSTIELLPQLQSLVVTEEDRGRVDQYRSIRERKLAREHSTSLSDYLESLDIQVTIARADDASLPRLLQVFQRTNQFNLTTRRYELAELTSFARDAERFGFYTLRARDRFGDHGLVAAALVRKEPQAWIVDSMILSCRVIGYGVETALLAAVAAAGRAQGVTRLVGEYIETKKNAPARDFYARHGFTEREAAGPATADGSSAPVHLWHLDLGSTAVEPPSWIAVEDQT